MNSQIIAHVQYESCILETVGSRHYLHLNQQSWKLTDKQMERLKALVKFFSNPLSATNFLVKLDKQTFEKA